LLAKFAGFRKIEQVEPTAATGTRGASQPNTLAPTYPTRTSATSRPRPTIPAERRSANSAQASTATPTTGTGAISADIVAGRRAGLNTQRCQSAIRFPATDRRGARRTLQAGSPVRRPMVAWRSSRPRREPVMEAIELLVVGPRRSSPFAGIDAADCAALNCADTPRGGKRCRQ
jgi:hypothetical protein